MRSEYLQIQYKNAKRFEKPEAEELKIALIEAKKNEALTCPTCSHKIEKELFDGFKTYPGIFCTKQNSELTINKDQSYTIHLLLNEYTGRPFYLHTALVYGCQSHSSIIETAPAPQKVTVFKKFDDYPILFTFSKAWTKLAWDVFTTIRSVDFNKKCKDAPNFGKGIIGRYIVNKKVQPNLIQVRDWMDKRIQDFELLTLQKDILPDICNTHQEFVQKLNDFYRNKYGGGNNRLTTVKRCFILRKYTWAQVQAMAKEKSEVSV